MGRLRRRGSRDRKLVLDMLFEKMGGGCNLSNRGALGA